MHEKEQKAISAVSKPGTRDSIRKDLTILGIQKGEVLLVHSSLSSLGWICGGAIAVIQALMDVLTTEGTLVMPAHSGDLSDPVSWQHPPVPEDWWQPIRENMPAFHPAYTPTRGIGTLPEIFRTMPGVLRSDHPQLSFTAFGRQAERILQGHSLEFALGENSPLARIYELDGRVLLLGCGHDSNTSFHLAEYRANSSRTIRQGAPVSVDGIREWMTFDDIDWNSDAFASIGEDFLGTGRVITGTVANARVQLFQQRHAVDFATDWLKKSS